MTQKTSIPPDPSKGSSEPPRKPLTAGGAGKPLTTAGVGIAKPMTTSGMPVSMTASGLKAMTSAGLSSHPKTDFTNQEITKLLSYSRSVIEATVCGESVPVPLMPALADAPTFGLFVSILRGTMRSCKGQLSPKDGKLGPLLLNVSKEAATKDMRFPSIHESELPYIAVELSMMHNPTALAASGEARADSVRVGVHGVMIAHPNGRGLLLPGVATLNKWSPKTFLDQLCGIAGLPVGAWKEEAALVTTFETLNYKDEPAAVELNAKALTPEMLGALVELSNSQIKGAGLADPKFPLLHRKYEHDLGVQVFTASGLSGLAVGQGHNLSDLTRNATRVLSQQFTLRKVTPEQVVRVNILWQPTNLKPEEYPGRHGNLMHSAVLVRSTKTNAWHLSLPNPSTKLDTVADALSHLNVTPVYWKNSGVRACAFGVLTYRALPLATQPPATPPTIRA